MRILFVSVPAQGHVRPLLGFALAARARGHDVAWATGASAADVLRAHGVPVFDAGLPFADALAAFRRAEPDIDALPGPAQALRAFPGLFGRVLATAMHDGLERAVGDWRPDLLVCEPAALAAPLAAARHRAPLVTHDFGLPIPAELLHASADAMAPAWSAAGLAVPPDAGLYGGRAIEVLPATLRRHGPPSIDAPVRLSYRAEPVTEDPGVPISPKLATFLERTDGRPRLYASFGTLHRAGPAWQALWQALCASSRPAIVTTGPFADLPDPAKCPEHLLVERFIPQCITLPHCTAVVSHGGAGVAFGAASAGLPQICLPQGADQFRNARALQAYGAAIVLDRPDRPTLDTALERVHLDAVLGASARALQADFAAMPSIDGSLDRLLDQAEQPLGTQQLERRG